MRFLRVILILLLPLAITACGRGGGSGKFHGYSGPEVTSIQVHKSDRKLYLLHDGKVLKKFEVSLGGNPEGPKQFEGDRKTPEGAYYITHRNPNSRYHLSLGISYPNPGQQAFAESQGKKPGGDIFIHGAPPMSVRHSVTERDWTAGCIAVSDDEIEAIYAMVKPGTPIYIFP
jgi:murein L,D-transpeptidase YafK